MLEPTLLEPTLLELSARAFARRVFAFRLVPDITVAGVTLAGISVANITVTSITLARVAVGACPSSNPVSSCKSHLRLIAVQCEGCKSTDLAWCERLQAVRQHLQTRCMVQRSMLQRPLERAFAAFSQSRARASAWLSQRRLAVALWPALSRAFAPQRILLGRALPRCFSRAKGVRKYTSDSSRVARAALPSGIARD
jgi:hypothetical protein